MKVRLKGHWHIFRIFTKLRRRYLTSAQWTLLFVTTAMLFLSAASTGCPTSGYGLSLVPNIGSGVTGNPPSVSDVTGNPPPVSDVAGNPPPVSDQLPSDSASSSGSTVSVPVLPDVTGGSPTTLTTSGGSPSATSATSGGDPSATSATSSGSSPTGNTVQIKMVTDKNNPSGFGFSPQTMTIKKGTTVTWVNVTTIPHTVTSDDRKFPSSDPSKPVMQGQMYSFTFTTAGTFKYHCAIHPLQVGTITVQ
jgi:plastocyanin